MSKNTETIDFTDTNEHATPRFRINNRGGAALLAVGLLVGGSAGAGVTELIEHSGDLPHSKTVGSEVVPVTQDVISAVEQGAKLIANENGISYSEIPIEEQFSEGQKVSNKISKEHEGIVPAGTMIEVTVSQYDSTYDVTATPQE